MLSPIITAIQSILPNPLAGNSLRSKQNSLLRILSISRSQGLDPKTLIENLAAEYPDAYGRKLMLLQRWIAAESSMSAALAHTPGVLDEDDALAIQCGIETDLLDATFESLLDRGDDDVQARAGDILRGALGYVVGLLFFTLGISACLMIFVVPMIAGIFEEFELQLPAAMSGLIEFSSSFGIILPLLLLMGIGCGCLLLFEDVRRVIRRSPLGRRFPTVATRQRGGLLRLLAIATEQGQPLGPTLTAAAQFHPDHRMRRRLLSARTESHSEEDLWRKLANHGLIAPPMAEQIGNITTSSLRAWTLTTLAERNHRRACQTADVLASSLQYIPVIVLGCFVAWITIAVMQTLTDLIRILA